MEHLEDSGLSQAKDKDGRTVFMKEPTLYGSINKERQKEAFEWIRRTGMGAALTERVSASALGRELKERLARNMPIKEDLVSYWLKKSLGHRSK